MPATRLKTKMYYLPPCIKYGVVNPARGIDALGCTRLAESERFVTRLSEYSISGSVAESAVFCLVWPAMIKRPAKNMPTNVPIKGNTNLRKWIWRAVSICIPIQKKPPMQPGMITKNTIGNLYKNSQMLMFIVNNFFITVTTPSPLL